LGAESDGAEAPTSLGIGLGQRHSEIKVWKYGMSQERRTNNIEHGWTVTRSPAGWSFLSPNADGFDVLRTYQDHRRPMNQGRGDLLSGRAFAFFPTRCGTRVDFNHRSLHTQPLTSKQVVIPSRIHPASADPSFRPTDLLTKSVDRK
jgi:hypothetical protein